MRFFSIVIVSCILLSALGCGSKVAVTGKVKFEDGTPLTTGEVRFEKEGFETNGKIQPDGTYRLGTASDTDGIPKGTYGVSVRALDISGVGVGSTQGFGVAPGDARPAAPPKSLIDNAFGSAQTSGLTCDVKGSRTFDITVRKPD